MARRSKLSVNWVIRFVPNDVWRRIFHFASLGTSALDTSGIIAVLRASHVCSLWRGVTDNAPELWASLVLKFRLEEDSCFPNSELLSLIIRKSRTMPLVMGLVATDRPTFNVTSKITTLKMFLRTMHRSKVLRLDLGVISSLDESQGGRQRMVGDLVQPARILESLEMNIPPGATDSISSISPLWKSAPLLQSLSFYRSQIGTLDVEGLCETGFPFKQLTSLELTCSISHSALISFLSLASFLVDAGFHGIMGPIDTSTQPVRHHRLKTLSLGGEISNVSEHLEPQLVMKLLECISCPGLTTLRLSFDCEWLPDSFKTFLTNSSARIEHLRLDIVGITDDDRIKCLAMLPSLLTLDLSFRAVEAIEDLDEDALLSEDLFDAMLERDNSTKKFTLCPYLEKLTVDYNSLADTTGTALADMFEKRSRFGPDDTSGNFEVVVKKADSVGNDLESASEMIRLLQLKKVGFKVTIEPRIQLERLLSRDVDELPEY